MDVVLIQDCIASDLKEKILKSTNFTELEKEEMLNISSELFIKLVFIQQIQL